MYICKIISTDQRYYDELVAWLYRDHVYHYLANDKQICFKQETEEYDFCIGLKYKREAEIEYNDNKPYQSFDITFSSNSMVIANTFFDKQVKFIKECISQLEK